MLSSSPSQRRRMALVRLSSILPIVFLAFAGLYAAPVYAGDLDGIRARGALRMICWPHQESLFIRRAEGEDTGFLDRFTGIDFELMRGFAAELGVELQVVPSRLSFSQMFPDLQAGTGDVAASSLTITPARQALFDFSEPYFLEHMSVVTLKGSTIDSESDLTQYRGSVVEGSSHDQRLRRLVPKEQVVYVSYTTDALSKVQDGEADYALVDSATFVTASRKYPEMKKSLEVAFNFPDEEAYGIAVRKGSDLLPPLNAYLHRLKSSGELDRLIREYRERYQDG